LVGVKYHQLINADFKLSEIGLGCASYWGKKRFSEKQAVSVVHRAIASGINYLDTGHSYSGDNAEIRLGKALASHSTDEIIVSSKAGSRLGHFGKLYKDFTPEWLERSCEKSLQRLGLERLPIFFLHGPNPQDFNDEVYATLERLQAAGKIGLSGVNTFDDHIIDLAVKSKQFQCVMLDYNLFAQYRVNTIRQLTEHGMDVMVAGGLGGGFYQKGFSRITSLKKMWYWLRALKNHRAKLSSAKSFDFLNNQNIGSAIQIALAFVLREPTIKSCLIGTTSIKHLDELVKATELELPAQLLKQIKQWC
jgi:aryl-alcohol dehydrogenase-like predicted oxidoreductase